MSPVQRPRVDHQPRPRLQIAWAWPWDLRNQITVEQARGDGDAGAPVDQAWPAWPRGVRSPRFALAWGRPLPPLAVSVGGEVPSARGMGSSATILVGVAAACRALAGLPFDATALVGICAEVEGIPTTSPPPPLGVRPWPARTTAPCAWRALRCRPSSWRCW